MCWRASLSPLPIKLGGGGGSPTGPNLKPGGGLKVKFDSITYGIIIVVLNRALLVQYIIDMIILPYHWSEHPNPVRRARPMSAYIHVACVTRSGSVFGGRFLFASKNHLLDVHHNREGGRADQATTHVCVVAAQLDIGHSTPCSRRSPAIHVDLVRSSRRSRA